MFSGVSSFILRKLGWEIVGDYPHDIQKKVIIVVPHTSNWDFPLGLLFRSSLKAKIHFVGKESLFRFPHGFIFRWLGGFPVKRDKNYNQVDQIVQYFNDRNEFALTLAPEGTRKKVDKLKTGFYHIAVKAKVPIVMIKFDCAEKQFVIHQPYYPTGVIEDDMKFVTAFFKGTIGLNPENSFL
jgi:1-acyl-sn-glycerol-3-phosphate acyltransferase